MNYDKVKMCVMCGERRATCGFTPTYCRECADARLTTGASSGSGCLNLFSGGGGYTLPSPSASQENAIRIMEDR